MKRIVAVTLLILLLSVLPLAAQCPCGCEQTGICICKDCVYHVGTHQHDAPKAVQWPKKAVSKCGKCQWQLHDGLYWCKNTDGAWYWCRPGQTEVHRWVYPAPDPWVSPPAQQLQVPPPVQSGIVFSAGSAGGGARGCRGSG